MMQTITRPARTVQLSPVSSQYPDVLTRLGVHVLRWSLVLVVMWFGAFKFTATEAAAIQPLIANSPVMSWMYHLMSVRTASQCIGVVEIAIAILVALRGVFPTLSAVGSAGAIAMFATTTSFIVTTPGSWSWVEGILVPSQVGAFLIKDVFIFGAALILTADALRARIAIDAGTQD